LERDEQVDSFRCINISMKDDLVELVVHLNFNCVVMGSNLGLNKITFFLLKIYPSMEVKRHVNPRVHGRVAEKQNTLGHLVIINFDQCHFRFSH